MSLSFWFNLTICVGALCAAWIDHGETLTLFKSSAGAERRRKGVKLFLLWGIPIVSLITTLIAARESVQSDTTIKSQVEAITGATNRLAIAESKLGPRRISNDQRTNLVAALSECPKGEIYVGACTFDREAVSFAIEIRDVLKSAGFEVLSPKGMETGEMSGETLLSVSHMGAKIVIKDAQKPPLRAARIQRCFFSAGIELYGIHSAEPDYDTNRVEIIVGQKE